MNRTETSDLSRENFNNVSEGDVEYPCKKLLITLPLNLALNSQLRFCHFNGKPNCIEICNVTHYSKRNCKLKND